MSRNSLRTHSMGNHASGSPFPGEPEFLAVGKLRRPHGLTGEIVMSVWTDFPERLTSGAKVFVGKDFRPLVIRSSRQFNQDLLVAFENVETREDVGLLRNYEVFVRTVDIPPLEEGAYYLHQLLGLRVVADKDDRHIGVIREILETGANLVFVVEPETGKDVLLPDIDSVVLRKDFDKGEIRVHLIPGLVPDEK